MAKYEVIRPWHGVKQGDIVDLKEVHPSLKPRVRLVAGQKKPELEVATPKAATKAEDKK